MEQVCPLCNGLKEAKSCCPQCGKMMVDGGRLEDFYDPYSPYVEQDFGDQVFHMADYRQTTCTHLFYCPHCGEDKRYLIRELYI